MLPSHEKDACPVVAMQGQVKPLVASAAQGVLCFLQILLDLLQQKRGWSLSAHPRVNANVQAAVHLRSEKNDNHAQQLPQGLGYTCPNPFV